MAMAASMVSLVRPLPVPQCLKPERASLRESRRRVCPVTASAEFTSPKTGALGKDRYAGSASVGTYWGPAPPESAERTTVQFSTGDQVVEVEAVVGENLLRVAERGGVLQPNEIEYCFEGTCSKCEMEVEGGTKEMGYRNTGNVDVFVKGCNAVVPAGRNPVKATIVYSDDVWEEGVV